MNALDRLTRRRFDILVIGGGIHGAFAAWDAALRGFDVALIDRGDFGAATSANSLKIAHGGLRYLQHGNIQRLRRTHREQQHLLRMAPHLVKPLPCVADVPGNKISARALASFALRAHAALASKRAATHNVPSLPPARVLTQKEYCQLAGPFAMPAANAGLLWFDAQIESPDRLSISIVRAAQRDGASVANYAEAVTLSHDRGRVRGALVRSDSSEGEVRARLVLLAANEGTAPLLATAGINRRQVFSQAFNVVVGGAAAPAVAVALRSWGGARSLFAVPWRSHLMLGTSQQPAGTDDAIAVNDLLSAVRSALPDFSLGAAAVRFVHRGFLPGAPLKLLDSPVIVDHAKSDGVAGVISLLGDKWTTARHSAALAIDLCAKQLDDRRGVCVTDTALPMGAAEAEVQATDSLLPAELPADLVARLRVLYGTEYREVAALAAREHSLARRLGDSTTIGAQVAFAVRHEFAKHLDDIVMRRTELGSAGYPGRVELQAAAEVAASELGWTAVQTQTELARVQSYYPAEGVVSG